MDRDASLEIYRSMVRRVIQEHRPIPMDNSSTDHAIVLIDELIRSATQSVDVYCKALSPEVWSAPSVLDALRHAIKAGVTFRIVTKDKPFRSEALLLLLQYGAVSFRMYAQEGLVANFLVIDNTAFRVEPDEKERKGFAYANNEKMSASVVQMFSDIWAAAMTVSKEKVLEIAQ